MSPLPSALETKKLHLKRSLPNVYTTVRERVTTLQKRYLANSCGSAICKPK